jgi:cytidylate kinase
MTKRNDRQGIPVLTIDGPSGSGKGTIARRVAAELGWNLLDSGALYRLTALSAARNGRDGCPAAEMAQFAAGLEVRFDSTSEGDELIYLSGEEVSGEVRTEASGLKASNIAPFPEVRQALIGLQRSFRRAPGLVADGRDMGTTIFPQAGLKVFLTASAVERAKRRHKQLKDKGIDVSLPALSRDIEDRDRRDTGRSVAPLRPAADARVLDSSDLNIDEVVEQVLGWAHELELVK